ncbi:hypothetical protein MKW92_016296 [Papaver armeniacum]|nr:hypothetical protein MKW92_016296 [Papaver armeniacum]
MFGKGKKKLDFKNYKGLKPTKINNKEGEEEFYGYGYTGKYLNNGEPIDFENNHGQLPNFGTHKPVEQYVRMHHPPINYGYTGKYLNNGEPIDFENNHGQLPNFGTHKPVEEYVRMHHPPINTGRSSRADWGKFSLFQGF